MMVLFLVMVMMVTVVVVVICLLARLEPVVLYGRGGRQALVEALVRAKDVHRPPSPVEWHGWSHALGSRWTVVFFFGPVEDPNPAPCLGSQ